MLYETPLSMSFTEVYFRWIRRILLMDLAFLVIGFLWRLAFMFLFSDQTALKAHSADLQKAFILGTRFDLSVLCYINAIPFLFFWLASLILLVPHSQRSKWNYQISNAFSKILPFYFTAFLLFITFINLIDLNFYSFYQDRINVLIFGIINDDTTALLLTIWKNYPVVWGALALTLFTYLVFNFNKKIFAISQHLQVPKNCNFVSYAIVIFFVMAVNFVGVRGSLGLFPLSEMDTAISSNAFINLLGFNSTRALARAIELKSAQQANWNSNLQAYGYTDDAKQAFADYYNIPNDQIPSNPLDLMRHTTATNKWAEQNRPHVLLIVMESFGSYWLKHNSSEFNLLGDLKNHFAEDNVLTNFMSSTGATIGSLSSLMIGTMQRPISDFLTESEYLQVPFRTSPAVTFKKSGYQTRFVYGGNPGWREVDKFARFQGFEKVDGENEITQELGTLNDRHDWGVYDQDVFKYLWKKIESAKEPQFILAMTTTNHPPYQLPKDYQKPELKIPEALKSRLVGDVNLPPKRFATYRYSADMLANFLHHLKQSPLKDKVIVAVTGDHTFWIVNFENEELLQKSAVPFYLYTPKAIYKKIPSERFGTHPDILPTLYNLALSNTDYYSTAVDLLDDKAPHYAFDHSSLILGADGGVQINRKRNLYFDWTENFESLKESPVSTEKEKMATHYKSLMGILDYYMMNEKLHSLSEQKDHANTRR